MAANKSGSQKSSKPNSRRRGKKKMRGVDPRAPWKASWYVLWGFLTVVGELTLIFLVRNKVVTPPIVQEVVIGVCIPIVSHLLISGIRTFLLAISMP
jgi:hypothetical protein